MGFGSAYDGDATRFVMGVQNAFVGVLLANAIRILPSWHEVIAIPEQGGAPIP